MPAQLPADLPDFAGREADLAELNRLLTPEGEAGRVITVTGMAGSGKTALAVHAAHAARSRFPDGQLYAEFGVTADPADVLGMFLTDLGVPAAELPTGLAERAKLFRGDAVVKSRPGLGTSVCVQMSVPGWSGGG